MTYKELAEKLGVKKDRVRYVAEHLPIKDGVLRIDGVMHLTDAAVNMVTAEILGSSRENSTVFRSVRTDDSHVHSEFASNSQCENNEIRGDSCENAAESAEGIANNCENNNSQREKHYESDIVVLTIIDQYKTVITDQSKQLAEKDSQIQKFTEFASAAMSDLNKQLTDANTAHAEQLTAKDAQLSRMQDTVDALTKQLADAAERERQLQATLEHSREQPRKWWMWWKR